MAADHGGGTSEQTSGRATRKGPSAFRTIGEASEELGVPQHVLRFWETKFTQLKPLKRAGGRRYYRPEDMELLGRIRDLLYQEGFTIKGAKRSLSQKTPSKAEEESAEAEEAALQDDGADEEREAEAASEEAPAAPAPLFESVTQEEPAPSAAGGESEARRLRAELQALHRELSLLRRQISERLSSAR